MSNLAYLVAVVGAGPAGLFAARHLAAEGARVVLFNRDIKPGGLAEYGIYPDKLKMKDGLRRQFKLALASPLVDYYGNTRVCGSGNLTIYDLAASCFQAILVTTGAQGTKWLGLDGEYMRGAYHAKDLVYHYNRLPPFATRPYPIGKRVALVGAGNVMMDIAHWLAREIKVDEVVTVVRRGPLEVKFTKDEAKNVARNFDFPALEAEFSRLRPLMESLGQSVSAARDLFTAPMAKALEPVSETRFRFEFLASPKRIIGEGGRVLALEVEENTLVLDGESTRAKALGTTRLLDVDTVVFCIGDGVDSDFCLPTQHYEYVKVATPRFPVDGNSYEAYDPAKKCPFENVFLAGWARQASTGLVGMARKDGENGAEAVMQYLRGLAPIPNVEAVLGEFEHEFERFNPRVARKDHLAQLEEAERAEAQQRGAEEYKFPSNEEMLAAMDIL